MNLLFWRRTALRNFAEAIQPELRAMVTPEPDPALLQRILASRAAGARIILPEAPEPARPAARLFTVGAIAAVLLLLVVPVLRRIPANPRDVTSVSFLLGSAAFAETRQPREALEPPPPSLPPIGFTRAGALRPLTLEMVRQVRDSAGKLTDELTATLSVAADTLSGTPAWRVTSTAHLAVGEQRRLSVESLYVARADLRMLRRSVHVSPYRRFDRINIQQRFPGDSVTGRMTTDGPSIGPGRPIGRELPQAFGPFVSEAMATLVLMPAPLAAGWTGSASLLGWAVIPRDFFTPMEFRVVATERVRVPAGEFDCWRLSLEFAGRRLTYWARQSDGLGVRIYEQTSSGTRDLVLRSIR